jgi:hypothetical protein
MHKSATKCHEILGKWCKNKHGASKIIDTFETYQPPASTTHLAAQTWGERSRSASAGTLESAGTAASDTSAADMSAYRPEAPVAEKAVAEVEEAAEQLARKATGAAP